jgi:hypothetical protein
MPGNAKSGVKKITARNFTSIDIDISAGMREFIPPSS